MPATASTKSRNGKSDRKVITLRIDPRTAKRLHTYSTDRARKLGRTTSYNETLIHLILDATAR